MPKVAIAADSSQRLAGKGTTAPPPETGPRLPDVISADTVAEKCSTSPACTPSATTARSWAF
jgi:hypothetical protein